MSRARILVGDCRESMASLPDASVDSVVTDPPYELGFMGRSWDASGIAYDLEVWRQALRVLKPGGHLLAFSGSRTYHRMTCAIEDAGFEVRDQIMWVYGSGFPKSHDVSKAIDKAAGAVREVIGEKVYAGGHVQRNATPRNGSGRLGLSLRDGIDPNPVDTAPSTDAARQWSGWGTALKPAHEPICLARKPLVGTVSANVLAHGTGAINVDGCRIGDESPAMCRYQYAHNHNEGRTWVSRERKVPETMASGRWPANFIHDGSDEATTGLGEAARFFYTAKASGEDRDEMIGDVPKNMHPTVKPTDLMRYLVRMVTPPGGTVLDPFTGSGSTGRGAMLEGMRFIGCELSPEYAEIARARIRYTLGPLFAHEVT